MVGLLLTIVIRSKKMPDSHILINQCFTEYTQVGIVRL
jgi:hypothetical protein